MKRISHSYFVVMQDLGQLGLEAIVHPERTRRGIVERICSGEYRDIAFIHRVSVGPNGVGVADDVTAELKGEASYEAAMAAIDDALQASE